MGTGVSLAPWAPTKIVARNQSLAASSFTAIDKRLRDKRLKWSITIFCTGGELKYDKRW